MSRFNLAHTTLALAAVITTTMGLASSAVANPSQRIIGGQPILVDDTPSIVALISSQSLQSTGSVAASQFCGGTLIDPSWVLTAAHCVVSNEGVVNAPDELKIVAQSHDLNNISIDPIDVARVIVHENYTTDTLTDDLALLQLVSPAAAVEESALLNTVPVELNEVLVTAGWGALQHDPEVGSFDFPDVLHAVGVLGLPAEICNTSTRLAGAVTDTMVCAGSVEGGADHCHGDSGGPLYRIEESGSLTVVGVISWGLGCGLPNAPGVYSDVLSFDSWIRSNMQPTVEEPVVVQVEEPVVQVEDPAEPLSEGANELTVTSNPDDGSTTVVIPSLASLTSASGSAGAHMIFMLAGFIAYRRRSVSRRSSELN